MKYTSIRGMTDILPQDAPLWHKLESAALSVFGAYGYSEMRTPIMEETELFVRGIGRDTAVVEKEMYTFDDAGNMVSLRPEGTASVVRAYIESGLPQTDPTAKFLYVGPMFRRERPQKGRYRQFYQIGVEAIGVADPSIDAEQIAMCEFFFRKLGLAEAITIEINSLGCSKCRPEYNKIFSNYLKAKHAHLCKDCQRRMEKNPLRVFDCKEEACKKALEDAPLIGSSLCKDCEEHFKAVQKGLNQLGVKFLVNHRIVRGLDYYMRTAFEFTTDLLGAQNAVAAGGRYDGLVKDLGGPDLPGIGFAIGMERVILLMQEKGLAGVEKPDVVFFATLGEAAREKVFSIVNILRQDGVRVETAYDGGSLKSQMRRADKLAARSVVIVGDDELKKGVATVRNMNTKEQIEVKLEDLARHFIRVEG